MMALVTPLTLWGAFHVAANYRVVYDQKAGDWHFFTIDEFDAFKRQQREAARPLPPARIPVYVEQDEE